MPSFSVLKKRRDFVKITKHGESVATSSLVLQAAPSNLSEPVSHPRIGYTTTKKIGKAHIRNRCRRRLRAAAALFFDKLALPDFDYVLIARYTTADVAFSTICHDLQYALQKINRRFMPESADDTAKNNTSAANPAD